MEVRSKLALPDRKDIHVACLAIAVHNSTDIVVKSYVFLGPYRWMGVIVAVATLEKADLE